MSLSTRKINSVFKALDLDTDEKREKFLKWYKVDESCVFVNSTEVKKNQPTKEIVGEKNAKLEQSFR